jgi:hypothetical protein
MDNRSSFNPYVLLGVDHSATDQEIQKAMQRCLAGDPDSAVRVEHAYRILKNPKLRKQLDEKLERMIWDIPDDPIPMAAAPEPKKPRRSFFGFSLPKLTILGALLAALTFTTYDYTLREQGIICPDCHHASVYSSEVESSQVLRCTRESCAFTYVHDELLEEEDERKDSSPGRSGETGV